MTSIGGVSIADEGRGSESPYEDSLANLLQRARAAQRAARWKEAAASYSAALGAAERAGIAAAKRAEIVGELGLCELQLGKHRDAAGHLAQSLADRSLLTPVQYQRFGNGWAKARKRVGTVLLSIDPPDAEVTVDGKVIGARAPVHEIYLEPGSHTIRGRLAGHSDYENTLEAVAGKQHEIGLRLPRAPDPPSVTMPAATLRAPSSTTTGAAPVRDGPSSTGTTLRIAGAAAAGTAVAVGASLLIWGAVTEGDLDDRGAELRRQGWTPATCNAPESPAECADLSGATDRRDGASTIGLVSLAAGAAIGAVTLGSFLVVANEKYEAERKGVRVVPVTDGRQAGLVLRGVW